MQFDKKDIEDNRVIAVFSYISCLVLIPLLGAKNSKFARYHANQGLVLLLFEIAFYVLQVIIKITGRILTSMLGTAILGTTLLSIAYWLISLFFTAVAIIGIVNVLNGKAKELPIIGKIKILK